ncbi:hypothetical protein [Sulfuriroseicoccus oceanibius]|uniref:Lipoprotein n=1 Tax=Sulfuriroseicoccus oceanibius TaxID=2707525 RepID=A0A6B3L6U4_9BACT|nr:hypothetical protein [Sulfuriroseicoccus oceanibius]QQL44899.1 hypothetical protein G3M56_013645 [Sulfuriroseicoccus oceanibius]
MMKSLFVKFFAVALGGLCVLLTSCEQTKPRGPQPKSSSLGWNHIRPGEGAGIMGQQMGSR